MRIKFDHDSLLDWSDREEGVQIFSEDITDEISLVAVLPHPAANPENASPSYYYFQDFVSGQEIPKEEALRLLHIKSEEEVVVLYLGQRLSHFSGLFQGEDPSEPPQSISR